MNARLIAALVPLVVGLAASAVPTAQSNAAGDVTFTKDIAPILQRSCQQCHRPDGVAPMPLTTYEEVRPWARAIKTRTGLGPRAGVMPPFFVERNIGIQHFKDDPSLSDEEIALVAKWVDNGAPRGNAADMPKPLDFANANKWQIGEPDLILTSKQITVPAVAPDWWGDVGTIPTGLTEDRYVAAVEVREVNDIPRTGQTTTVGGRYVWHHQTYSSIVPGERGGAGDEGGTSWPIHEVGRNPDIFPPESGRLLAANSSLSLSAAHIHANGRETKAHLEFAF
jgi:mono/diheme cytochrome c family protein